MAGNSLERAGYWVLSLRSLRIFAEAKTLLPKIDDGRIAAQEILLCNAAVRHLIREDKIAQIYSQMQTGTRDGMRTLETHIKELYERQLISAATAETHNSGI